MRLSTVALLLIALGVATVSAAVASDETVNTPVVARDFERKMQVREARKHSVAAAKRSNLITNGMLTWYGGGQLDNPACGGSTPSKWDHVVAVKEGGNYKCGDMLHIHYGGKMVPAKVVDYCGGCASNHIDLTQGLFQEFAALSAGEIHGARIKKM